MLRDSILMYMLGVCNNGGVHVLKGLIVIIHKPPEVQSVPCSIKHILQEQRLACTASQPLTRYQDPSQRCNQGAATPKDPHAAALTVGDRPEYGIRQAAHSVPVVAKPELW